MPAYVISEAKLRDPTDTSGVAAYLPLARQAVLDHGGDYLARDVAPQTLEGEFAPEQRVVLIRFATVDRAREWYASPDYRRALSAAAGGLDRRLFIVEGHINDSL